MHPDDLDAEVRSHLAHRADDLEREGMPREEAERRARLEFGGLESHKEAVRDAEARTGLTHWLSFTGRDLVLAIRRLRRSPLYATVAVLSLAVGVALPTTVYALLRATIWTDAPVKDPAELVVVTARNLYASGSVRQWSSALSFPDVRDYVAAQQSFGAIAWETSNRRTVPIGAEGASATVTTVSGRFFEVLGVPPPLFGRVIGPEDDRPDAPAVVVLSHQVWRRALAGRPDAVGSTLSLNGQPFTVIGVMPASYRDLDFTGPTRPAIWVPMSAAGILPDAMSLQRRDTRSLTVVGRLLPGVTVARASAEATALGATLDGDVPLRSVPGGATNSPSRDWAAADYETLRSSGLGRASQVAYVLASLAGLVLLVACSNLANLAFARGTVRQPEFAIRRALGATRGRLVRELFAESALVAVAGLALSVLLVRVLLVVCTVDLPVSNQQVMSIAPMVDAHVLRYAAGAVTLALLIFGAEPAMQLTRTKTATTLAQGARSVMRGTRRHRIWIRLQVASAFSLLVITSVAVHYSLWLTTNDSGVNLDRLAVGTVAFLPQEHFAGIDQRQATEDVLSALRGTPGIDRAEAATGMPFGLMVTPPARASNPERPTAREAFVYLLGSTTGYLQTIGIRIERGRGFDARDTANATPVAILSAAAAQSFFGSTDVVGRTITVRTEFSKTPRVTPRLVVGIASDTDVQSRGARRTHLIHVPLTQTAEPFVTFVATGSNPEQTAGAIQRAVTTTLPTVAATGVGPGVAMLAPAVPLTRIASGVTLVLGISALGLSMIGLHGVLSHILAIRTREMALRLALGANRRQVWWLAIREGLRPVAGGLAIGLVIGGLARFALINRLNLTSPSLDILIFVGVPALFVGVAVVACAAPARRASRVDPNVVLRDA